MRKQYTLEQNRIEDIQKDPSKYLPIAMYAIGCHMGEMTEQELEGLMSTYMTLGRVFTLLRMYQLWVVIITSA